MLYHLSNLISNGWGPLRLFRSHALLLAGGTLLARRPDWDHPILTAVVEVCGGAGCNWFDMPSER